MRITIIGGGAIGLLFAGKLAASDQSVHVITHHQLQSDELNQQGVSVVDSKGKMTYPITSSAAATDMHECDCVIVTVKQYQLNSIREILDQVSLQIPVIFAQNGMGHLEFIKSLRHEKLYVSTIEHGAEKVSSTNVKHNGVGLWSIAGINGKKESIDSLFVTDNIDFPIIFSDNYEQLLGLKLIKNILINSLTALFNVRNGELISNPYLHNLLQNLYNETMTLFPQLINDLSIHDVEILCLATANNHSSMNRDLNAKRPTEVDAIIGYALNRAAEMKKNAPLLHFLYEGILSIEYRKGIRS